tara:strand:+ start:299 stop:493 length:195 start_codon:yes stop_codon:yes gene_type:complete
MVVLNLRYTGDKAKKRRVKSVQNYFRFDVEKFFAILKFGVICRDQWKVDFPSLSSVDDVSVATS